MWHVETHRRGRLVNVQSFPSLTEAQEALRREREEGERALASALSAYAEDLRAFCLDSDTGEEPQMPRALGYTYGLSHCTEALCVACMEVQNEA